MTIEVPEELEAALKAQAEAYGVSAATYALKAMQGRVAPVAVAAAVPVPHGKCESFETGYGMWAKYDVDISAADIEENRREMFKDFGAGFDD